MKDVVPVLLLIIEAMKILFKKDKSSVPLSIEILKAKNQDDIVDLVKRIGDEWNEKGSSDSTH